MATPARRSSTAFLLAAAAAHGRCGAQSHLHHPGPELDAVFDGALHLIFPLALRLRVLGRGAVLQQPGEELEEPPPVRDLLRAHARHLYLWPET